MRLGAALTPANRVPAGQKLATYFPWVSTPEFAISFRRLHTVPKRCLVTKNCSMIKQMAALQRAIAYYSKKNYEPAYMVGA